MPPNDQVIMPSEVVIAYPVIEPDAKN